MSNDYSIAVLPLACCLHDTLSLWKSHWDEQGEEAARRVPFNPDVDGFLDAEARGWFAYIAVKHGDALVGHFGLQFHKNRQTSLYSAGDEFVYLKPEHRKGFLAARLIRFAKDLAFRQGAVEFNISFRTFGSVDITPLLERCGLRHIANVHSARKGDN